MKTYENINHPIYLECLAERAYKYVDNNVEWASIRFDQAMNQKHIMVMRLMDKKDETRK